MYSNMIPLTCIHTYKFSPISENTHTYVHTYINLVTTVFKDHGLFSMVLILVIFTYLTLINHLLLGNIFLVL